MNIIIDWSCIYNMALASLTSGNKPITRPDMVAEFKYRLAERTREVLESVGEVKNVIFAMDYKTADGNRKYWREGYMKNWYAKNHVVLNDPATGDKYIRYDNKTFLISETIDSAIFSKAIAKTKMPANLEAIIVTPEQTALYVEAMPKYKGNRSKDWLFAVPRDVMITAAKRVVYDLTAIIPNSRIVSAEDAEADDVMAYLVNISKEPHIIATIDGDWSQAVIGNDVKIFNLSFLKFIDYTEADAIRDLGIKLISGDAGDNVKSTWIDGKAVNLGEKKAIAIYDNSEQDTINQSVYLRNQKLIRLDLDTIPKYVQKNIHAAVVSKVRNDTIGVTWNSAFTMTNYEEQILIQEGLERQTYAKAEASDDNVLDQTLTSKQKFNTNPKDLGSLDELPF